ncbi:39S ribosomal protein L10, mitochondrial [Cimex lectularius]|uniref:Large ribosomal subunit protein uL10m n=1 Tax=Cimex lectularius TaxID=79782 RepID=A0A8I6RWY1_CIMLE|nr:39S ribosomal protein L10, mitochondrial [Cimex lectularius]
MASFVREGLLSFRWQPSLHVFRNRRVNVQRPRAPHYDRARVLALLKPQYAEEETLYEPPSVTCRKLQELKQYIKRPDNPLEKILAKELFEKCEKSQLIAFFHKNPISGLDDFNAKIKFRREQMEVEVHSKYTAKLAFEGTNYESVLELFMAHNAMAFCDEPKVNTLLKITKKLPQYVLLCAIVEGKMLNMSQLVSYAQFKDINQARAQLVATLNLAGTEFVSRLSQPQNTLVSQLGELVKIKGEKS